MILKYNNTILYFVLCFSFNYHGHSKPMETHFPGYHFCGPGTQYWERISRGQYGVNKLDEACRSHDLTYTSPDLESRIEADRKLEMEAWNRVTAQDSGYKEKIAAWFVTNFMKIQGKWNHSRLRREATGKKRRLGHEDMLQIKKYIQYLENNQIPLLQKL